MIKSNKIIIKGKRNTTGLWIIPRNKTKTPSTIPLKPENMANGIIRLDQTKRDLAQYISDALFNPATSTLIQAIKKRYFTSWLGLNKSLISKHLPKTIVTTKGHLDKERMNQQSTKKKNTTPVTPPSPPSAYGDINPQQYVNNNPSDDIMCMMIENNTIISKSYSNQT